MSAVSPFAHPHYLLRRKFLTFAGAKFHIYDPAGNLAFFSKQKAFKLKEDIRVFADEEMKRELLVITARNIIDVGATYDVHDATTREHVGSLRRRGIKSMVKDEWMILNPYGQQIGTIAEDSLLFALLRRLIAGQWLPQEFHGTIGGPIAGQPADPAKPGTKVCEFVRNFNPFISKITLDFSSDRNGLLDRRLGIAAGILLLAIEGKQS